LPALAASLRLTLTQANNLLVSADTGYGNNSKFSRDLERLMLQLNDMARLFRVLSDLLTRHPEALIRDPHQYGAGVMGYTRRHFILEAFLPRPLMVPTGLRAA
jgi:hypothetical protein